MTDAAVSVIPARKPGKSEAAKHTKARYRAEARFRAYGLFAILLTAAFLLVVLLDILIKGVPAFTHHSIKLPIQLQASVIDPNGARDPQQLYSADYQTLTRDALRAKFPEATSRVQRRTVDSLISEASAQVVRDYVVANPQAIGTTVTLPMISSAVSDLYYKGYGNAGAPGNEYLDVLKGQGLVARGFNWSFFGNGDSRDAAVAGVRGAMVGSALTLIVTLIICVPLGVGAAIYLEEFAPKNRLTEIIEININNLAAVPSIVFGLLGLAVFLNFFGLPRSAALVGGLVLSLVVLPTIIITARAALKAVPPSIKEAALGVGASQQQAIFHHVLPLAVPGIMTGTIIGMAHALGETAPLLLIGMVAFIVEPALNLTDAATVLPVQIYLWSDLPEVAFQAKTSAAIIVLLVFLFIMNGAAIMLRKRFERRW